MNTLAWTRRKLALVALLVGVWMGEPLAVQAAPINLHIVSDGAWRSNDSFFTGWELVGFDDSTWPAARAPYPSPSTPGVLIPGTNGQFIWHDPLGLSPDGGGPPDEVFLRRTFTLSLQPDSLPLIGQALVSVDDDYDFFVNGQLVFQNHDQGFAHLVQFIDFTSALHNGDNVFAIHAVDGGWGNPFDRSFQRVLFDSKIRTITIPEPSTCLLLASAVLVYLAMARGTGGARRSSVESSIVGRKEELNRT